MWSYRRISRSDLGSSACRRSCVSLSLLFECIPAQGRQLRAVWSFRRASQVGLIERGTCWCCAEKGAAEALIETLRARPGVLCGGGCLTWSEAWQEQRLRQRKRKRRQPAQRRFGVSASSLKTCPFLILNNPIKCCSLSSKASTTTAKSASSSLKRTSSTSKPSTSAAGRQSQA